MRGARPFKKGRGAHLSFELLVKVVKAARSRKAQRPAARNALAASGAASTRHGATVDTH